MHGLQHQGSASLSSDGGAPGSFALPWQDVPWSSFSAGRRASFPAQHPPAPWGPGGEPSGSGGAAGGAPGWPRDPQQAAAATTASASGAFSEGTSLCFDTPRQSDAGRQVSPVANGMGLVVARVLNRLNLKP